MRIRDQINDILLNSAKNSLQQKRHTENTSKKKKNWFNRNCFSLNKEIINLGRQLCRTRAAHETRLLFFKKKKKLRHLIKKKKKIV